MTFDTGVGRDVLADDAFPDGYALESRLLASGMAAKLVANVENVVRGRRAAVEIVAIGLLSGGHVLIQDIPGSGKTTLAHAFARSLGGKFRRVQGTADLLPSDITGSSLWDPAHQEFRFVPGPVFTNVLLVDELNRATPRAQSALLEAMDERAVTVDGVRHELPDPFFVVATQNPVDQYGTFPLPESQLDRFAVCLGLGFNDLATERRVMRDQLVRPTVGDLKPVLTPEELRWLQLEVRRTFIADPVLDFALAILAGTRRHPSVAVGASSRAGLSLLRCAQARALLAGRNYVIPDDVKVLAPTVLGHRLVLAAGARSAEQGRNPGADVVHQVLADVRVPLPG